MPRGGGFVGSRRVAARELLGAFLGTKANFDSRKVTDGYHEFRFVARSGSGPMTTKSKMAGIIVQNRGVIPKLKKISESYSLNEEIKLEMDGSPHYPIKVQCQGRQVATKPHKDFVTVSCKDLGKGPIKIRPSISIDGKEICLQPVDIIIFD